MFLKGHIPWICFHSNVCFVFLFWICTAELQFAFICFLIGNVYDAFEHWKRLLNILCRSEDAIRKYQDLYINLISVLYHQLSEIPADFFVDIVSQDNFLTSTLQVCLLLPLERWQWEERALEKLQKQLSYCWAAWELMSLSKHTHVCFYFFLMLFPKRCHLLVISEFDLLKLCLEEANAV